MARQLVNKQVILAKYGATPTTSNVVTISKGVIFSPKVKTGEINELTGKVGSKKTYSVADDTTISATISAVARTISDKTTPPSLNEMFKICGLEENIDNTSGSEKVFYTPTSNFPNNGEIVSYIDGEKRAFTGVSGNLKMSFTVGDIVNLNFDIQGFTDAVPTLEANPSVTRDTNKIFVVKSIDGATVGGVTICLTNLDFDMGVDIKKEMCIGSKKFKITDIDPTLTIKDNKNKGNNDHWEAIKNGELKAVVVTLTNTVGDKFIFEANKCSLKDLSEEDSDGKVGISRVYRCENLNGNDNFKITYIKGGN